MGCLCCLQRMELVGPSVLSQAGVFSLPILGDVISTSRATCSRREASAHTDRCSKYSQQNEERGSAFLPPSKSLKQKTCQTFGNSTQTTAFPFYHSDLFPETIGRQMTKPNTF